jgi:hypothetical protein
MTQLTTGTWHARGVGVEVTETLRDDMVYNNVTVGPDASTLLGLEHDPQRSATTKTIKMRDRDILATDDTVLASLSGMSTTVTKMTDPHDHSHWLFIAFTYRVTSRGWRTGRGTLAGETLGVPHGLYFLNRDSGPVFSWGFPYQDFTTDCGWVNHQAYYPIRDHDSVSWFSDWHRVSWRLSDGGYFYPC